MPPCKRIKIEITSDMEENCPNSMGNVVKLPEESYQEVIRNLSSRNEELENQNKIKDEELSLKEEKIKELEEIVKKKSFQSHNGNILSYSQLKKTKSQISVPDREVDPEICSLEEQRILRWEYLENVNRMRNCKFLKNSVLTDSFIHKNNPGGVLALANSSIEGQKIINFALDKNSLKIKLVNIDQLLCDRRNIKGRKLKNLMRNVTSFEIGLRNIKEEVEETPNHIKNKAKVDEEFANISLASNVNTSLLQLDLDYQEMKNLSSFSFLNKDLS